MHLRNPFFFFMAALAGLSALSVGACSSVTESSPGSSGSGGSTASAVETDRCKKSCDKMKFFDCSSADEQARCYADCDKASSSQIQVFTGCAENSICDPQCRTTIQPKETAETGGTGASAATCATACDKLVSCNKIPVGAKGECNAQCASKGYQYQIDCVNKTACASLEATCGGSAGGGGPDIGTTIDGGGPDKTNACLAECDSINFFKCAPVESHATCRDECTKATATAQDAFTSCSTSSGVDCERKKGCLDAFLK